MGKRTATLLAFSLAAAFSLRGAALPIRAAQGLEVSPTRTEVQVQPGEHFSYEIKLRNLVPEAVTTQMVTNDFIAKGDDGTVAEGAPGSPPTRSTVKGWVHPPPPIDLSPLETKAVALTVQVPKDAEPGGHYGVVRFTPLKGAASSSSAFSSSIGSLLLLTVTGDIKEHLTLSEFSVTKDGQARSLFFGGPLELRERLHNEGSVHERPEGTVEIKDWRGQSVMSLPLNPLAGAVLPDSTRAFTQAWQPSSWLPGRYSATLQLSYGAEGGVQHVERTLTFRVVPIKTLLLLLGTLLAILVALWGLLRRGRRLKAKRRAS